MDDDIDDYYDDDDDDDYEDYSKYEKLDYDHDNIEKQVETYIDTKLEYTGINSHDDYYILNYKQNKKININTLISNLYPIIGKEINIIGMNHTYGDSHFYTDDIDEYFWIYATLDEEPICIHFSKTYDSLYSKCSCTCYLYKNKSSDYIRKVTKEVKLILTLDNLIGDYKFECLLFTFKKDYIRINTDVLFK